MSAVSYPAEGGPSLDTVRASLAHVVASGRVAAISVTMWNPELDKDDTATDVVLGLIDEMVEQISG